MKRILVATIVLGLMLSGGAVAAKKITSADIKNGTIKSADISKSAKRALKGNRGSTGPAGQQGPAGPVATGTITQVQSILLTIAPGDIGTVNVNCPPGMNIVSGGFESASADGEIFFASTFGSPTSYAVGLDNFDSPVEADVSASALCAPAGKAVLARRVSVKTKAARLVAQQRAAHR